jgi:hypothetical protein
MPGAVRSSVNRPSSADRSTRTVTGARAGRPCDRGGRTRSGPSTERRKLHSRSVQRYAPGPGFSTAYQPAAELLPVAVGFERVRDRPERPREERVRARAARPARARRRGTRYRRWCACRRARCGIRARLRASRTGFARWACPVWTAAVTGTCPARSTCRR